MIQIHGYPNYEYQGVEAIFMELLAKITTTLIERYCMEQRSNITSQRSYYVLDICILI